VRSVRNVRRPRVVFDTNVLVSALVFGGILRQAVDLIGSKIGSKSVRPVMSEAILTELRRIISVKFPEFAPLLSRYESLLRHYAFWVPLGGQVVSVVRDPDDNAILETSLVGKCEFVTSGDKDLLALGTYKGIRIVTPAELVELLKE